MKLWKIYQDINATYETYDSAIVAAESKEAAINIHPAWQGEYSGVYGEWRMRSWCAPENVGCTLIGEALPDQSAGVILASFNARFKRHAS